MKIVFKLMMFSIVLNFAVGIMLTALPVFDNPVYKSGVDYQDNYASEFNASMSGAINPTGDLEDLGDAFDRLLDKIGLGAIKKLLTTIDKYMFGFVQILENIFAGGLGPDLSFMIFSVVLRPLITIGYILGAWWLWTGKDLGGR